MVFFWHSDRHGHVFFFFFVSLLSQLLFLPTGDCQVKCKCHRKSLCKDFHTGKGSGAASYNVSFGGSCSKKWNIKKQICFWNPLCSWAYLTGGWTNPSQDKHTGVLQLQNQKVPLAGLHSGADFIWPRIRGVISLSHYIIELNDTPKLHILLSFVVLSWLGKVFFYQRDQITMTRLPYHSILACLRSPSASLNWKILKYFSGFCGKARAKALQKGATLLCTYTHSV